MFQIWPSAAARHIRGQRLLIPGHRIPPRVSSRYCPVQLKHKSHARVVSSSPPPPPPAGALSRSEVALISSCWHAYVYSRGALKPASQLLRGTFCAWVTLCEHVQSLTGWLKAIWQWGPAYCNIVTFSAASAIWVCFRLQAYAHSGPACPHGALSVCRCVNCFSPWMHNLCLSWNNLKQQICWDFYTQNFTHAVCQKKKKKGNPSQLVLLHLGEIEEDVAKRWLFDAPGISTG